MPKIIELRQDQTLVNSNFDGYKLSLESVPIIRQDLEYGPFQATANNEEQYSLLHAELFTMQNLLHADPWERTMGYFVNKKDEIIRIQYNENTGRPETPQVVYRFEKLSRSHGDNTTRRIIGDYNYSMNLISEKFCVVCNGIEDIYLFDTGDRLRAPEWKIVAQHKMEERNYMLYDCRLDVIQAEKQVSLALGRVERVAMSNGAGCAHCMKIYWARWIQKTEWQFTMLGVLVGKGSLYYCGFEPKAESLIISSNRCFQFESENQNGTKEPAPMEENSEEEKPQLHDGEEIQTNWCFTWSQTNDDVTVRFEANAKKSKSDYNVQCNAKHLSVKCGDEIMLEHELHAKVDVDLFTWTMDNNLIEVTLVKNEQDVVWPNLLANGAGPAESSEGSSSNCLPIDRRPVINLEAPIEECDFPMDSADIDNAIYRFHLPSRSITHSVLLGGTPPIFSTSLRPGFPQAIVTRQDVDACLWLQQYNPSKPDEWCLRHEGNLHAFAYVQASKQQRKFIDCSPDLSYAVICESFRHIFLYHMRNESASGLRNRNGPQVHIGKQHLISLEDAGEILGVSAAPSVLILLTEKCVLYLQI